LTPFCVLASSDGGEHRAADSGAPGTEDRVAEIQRPWNLTHNLRSAGQTQLLVVDQTLVNSARAGPMHVEELGEAQAVVVADTLTEVGHGPEKAQHPFGQGLEVRWSDKRAERGAVLVAGPQQRVDAVGAETTAHKRSRCGIGVELDRDDLIEESAAAQSADAF